MCPLFQKFMKFMIAESKMAFGFCYFDCFFGWQFLRIWNFLKEDCYYLWHSFLPCFENVFKLMLFYLHSDYWKSCPQSILFSLVTRHSPISLGLLALHLDFFSWNWLFFTDLGFQGPLRNPRPSSLEVWLHYLCWPILFNWSWSCYY